MSNFFFKLIHIFEWAVAYISLGLVAMTFLFVMFADSPSFGKNFTSSQKLFFETQGGWILFVLIGIIACAILAWVKPLFPWRHVAFGIGLFGVLCSFVIFTAF